MISMEPNDRRWRYRLRSPWASSIVTTTSTLLGLAVVLLMAHSFLTRQLDVKGCEMAWMRPNYAKFNGFSTEHTRFADKYSLWLYREGEIDNEFTVKGVPVLFIPGNAGSYKQVRSLAAEAAYHYYNELQPYVGGSKAGKRPLDFFSVDFNEDFTAFHGQTLLDQAEYLNDAIAYILALYHTPGLVMRDDHLPDPTSVIIVGHSMGGVVARTMFTLPNYQTNSINTIITLAAPHARPPISFDGDIVRIYDGVNSYWKHAYSQVDNPLSQVTLVSIAGGGLDTIISSDYASIDSIIPETHGFTVFTSSMPNVWTGMDHLAITWCDQNRKSIVKALYDVIDVSTATQTIPVIHRMFIFKKWFLTGLEDVVEKLLPRVPENTLVTVDHPDAVTNRAPQYVMRKMGYSLQRPNVRFLPVPLHNSFPKQFSLLTNEWLDQSGDHGNIAVLVCRPLTTDSEYSISRYRFNINLSEDSTNASRYACKNAASDAIVLPASTRHSTHPFKVDQHPFSYLIYDLKSLENYPFVCIVDKASTMTNSWVIAEFTNISDIHTESQITLWNLLTSGLSSETSSVPHLMTDVKIPTLQSSLLAYKFRVNRQHCEEELFAPLLRQYIANVYESKFFVNVEDANINLHGVSPYMPPALRIKHSANGLSLQYWSDPTCKENKKWTLQVDILGSLGKLWMRYRIVFAAFPLLIVALVLRRQFDIYDQSGHFITFSHAINNCLYSSIPLTISSLTILSVVIAAVRYQSSSQANSNDYADLRSSIVDDAYHGLLLGSGDVFFWFLVPLFGLMSIGICVALNFVALLLEHIFELLVSIGRSPSRNDEAKLTLTTSSNISTQRIITSLILFTMVSTVVPYHFAYVVLCLVQLTTCARSLQGARDSQIDAKYNFYNYAHSTFILMLWILPINIPVLVVWIRNLLVGWLTPFSPHHNILSILPFVLLVETQSTQSMIPRMQSRWSLCTNVLIYSIGAYTAVYGVTYAYVLHHLANILCAWLLTVHFGATSVVAQRDIGALGSGVLDEDVKKA